MGPIASFIDGLDKAAEKEDAAKKALDISIKMIQTRFDNFEANLNLPIGDVKKVPAQYLIASKRIISCNVSQGTQQNKQAIQGIVGDFANGETAKGIVNSLFTGLDMILGSFNASYDETQDYMVLTNLIGGVYRIDYLVVQQKIEGKGFSDKVTSVFGSYLIITAINKKELLTDNVYKILVDRQFASFTVFIKFILVKLLKEEELTPEEVSAIGNLTYEDLKFKDGMLLNAEGELAYPDQKKEPEADLTKIKLLNQEDIDDMTSEELQVEIELNKKIMSSLQRAIDKDNQNKADLEAQVTKTENKIQSLSRQLEAQQAIANLLNGQVENQRLRNMERNLGQLHLNADQLNTVRDILRQVQRNRRQEEH